jgi:hypothetical protein
MDSIKFLDNGSNITGFMHLKNTFPRISDGEIKEVVFVEPQTRELIQNGKFEAS